MDSKSEKVLSMVSLVLEVLDDNDFFLSKQKYLQSRPLPVISRVITPLTQLPMYEAMYSGYNSIPNE